MEKFVSSITAITIAVTVLVSLFLCYHAYRKLTVTYTNPIWLDKKPKNHVFKPHDSSEYATYIESYKEA